MRRNVWALALVVVTAHAGCRWPIPSCEEGVRIHTGRSGTGVRLREDGAFSENGGPLFASCREYCAAVPGVVEVLSCEGPVPAARLAGRDEQVDASTLRCEVYAVQCHHDYPLGNGGLLGGGGFGNTGFGGHEE